MKIKMNFKGRFGHNQTKTETIVAAYQKDDEINVVTNNKFIKNNVYIVNGIDIVIDAGYLTQIAGDRLINTKENDYFKYRNKKMRRMTTEEIKEIVNDKTFLLTFDHADYF